MDKKIIIAAAAIIAVAVAAVLLSQTFKKTADNGQPDETPQNKLSPLNAKYILEGRIVSLDGGKEETVSPYGAEKQITEVWGTPVSGDLNSDGEPDYALILTQRTANDVGVYYYAAIALADEKAGIIAGSNAVAIGDRVDVKDLAIINNAVRINYLDWKTDGDDVEAAPTAETTKTFILDGIMLKELTERRANAQAEAACTDNRGEWNKETNECKGLTQELCQQFAGKFENDLCKF